jgi:hypothetical protein
MWTWIMHNGILSHINGMALTFFLALVDVPYLIIFLRSLLCRLSYNKVLNNKWKL